MAATPLNTNALTTLEVARVMLGLTETDANNDLAARLVNAASDFLENACSRKFLLTAEVEAVAGYGTARLVVARAPIKTLTGITYDGASIDMTDVTFDAGEGLISKPGGFIWTAQTLNDISGTPAPGTERKLYEVTYTGGYITPQHDGDGAVPFSGGARDLPYDLEEAVLSYIRSKYHARRRDPNIKSEKLRTWSATYGGGSGGGAGSSIPGDVADVIAAYQRAC